VTPPPQLAALARWIEQLIAESSGKDGRGVVPIIQDPRTTTLPDTQSLDATQLFLRSPGSRRRIPPLGIRYPALCEELGVNPFDQPMSRKRKRLAAPN